MPLAGEAWKFRRLTPSVEVGIPAHRDKQLLPFALREGGMAVALLLSDQIDLAPR